MSNKRPPVFFTIVAIKHEPLKALGDYIPRIQDALRKRGYSGQVQESTMTMSGDSVAQSWPDPLSKTSLTERRYTLFNANNSSAFTFNDGGVFAYHTSAYTSREELFKQVELGLSVLHEHVQLQTLIRVGVRMLDLIRPSDFGHSLADFVQESLRGFSAISATSTWQQKVSTLEHRFIEDSAEITARLDCLPDAFGVRSDLMNDIQGHNLPAHLTNSSGAAHAILDIDSGTRGGAEARDFSLEDVMEELVEHKDRISKLFNASVTKTALKAWGLQ